MKETTLTGESKDILNENIETLKELFPEIVSEDKIDFDKFKTIFGGEIDDSSERYSFTWPGKTQAIKESQKQSTGTLRPCKEESKNWDSTKNLYIEGDNLEVLKMLQKGYYNKVKAIYIDPPYNTGKDFIYSDNYSDNLENYLKISGQVSELGDTTHTCTVKLSSNTETSGRFHSNWLNMLYPRLKLARNLLSSDGLIFISINDNEVENLKKLCNEIFGEQNFFGTLIWMKGKEGGNDNYGIGVHHEYILIYSKNYLEGAKSINLDAKDTSRHITELSEENLVIPGNSIYKDGELFQLINLSKQKDYVVKIPLKTGETIEWPSYCPQKTIDNMIDIGKLFVGSKKVPYVKSFLSDESGGTKPSSLITQEYGTTKKGGIEIKGLFDGKKVFSYPKPSSLIKRLLKISTNENDLVLDFFSGSATTVQAIFNINNEDSGSRKFIMIQIPEAIDEKSEAYKVGYKNICEIGKERIRRAGDKIVQESGNKDLDIGFKVFKLDSSNLNKWDPDYDDLEQTLLVSQDNIKEDRTQEDLIYEIMLKYGIDLTLPIEEYDAGENKIYSIGFGALLICLDNKITKDIADSIIELASEDVSRVVFKDNGFASDADKTNIKETLRTHGIDEFITI